MFYHFLASEGGHPIWVENFIEKTLKCKVLFSKTHHVLINKSSDVMFQNVQQIYTRLFPIYLLLTHQETLYSLNIVLSFHPPFEPITALFIITGLYMYSVGLST